MRTDTRDPMTARPTLAPPSMEVGAPSALAHQVTDLGDVRLHYVSAGRGDTVLLLAGFPQTWYAWRKVIPALAEKYSVVAVDLPGQGDSSRPESGYDTQSMADTLRRFIDRLAVGPVFVAAHDVGAWTAYPLAAKHPAVVRRLALLDGGIPGISLPDALPIQEASRMSFHFLFHLVPDLPEQFIHGREREYVAWFLRAKAFDPGVFTDADIDEYARCYAAAGGMRAALGWYRAVPLDASQNRELGKTKLAVPVLALGGRQGATPNLAEALRAVAVQVEGEPLEDCGHFLPEEQPAAVSERLLRFFGTD